MKNKIKLLFLILFIFYPFKSLALIEVDITRGNLNPLPVAVSSLSSTKDDKEALKKVLDINDLGLEISKIVENNLKKSGLFKEYADNLKKMMQIAEANQKAVIGVLDKIFEWVFT